MNRSFHFRLKAHRSRFTSTSTDQVFFAKTKHTSLRINVRFCFLTTDQTDFVHPEIAILQKARIEKKTAQGRKTDTGKEAATEVDLGNGVEADLAEEVTAEVLKGKEAETESVDATQRKSEREREREKNVQNLRCSNYLSLGLKVPGKVIALKIS